MFTPGSRTCGYKTASGLGKWPNRDPNEEFGGLNLYEYVRNNPINWVDPFGLGTWSITIENDDSTGSSAYNARPAIDANYTEDADEKKCCDQFKIKRTASGLASSSSDDDPNGGYSVGGYGASSGDQPGGSGIFQGPQLIPATFHFTWTAICIKGCCAGKVLSQTSRDYHLWLYTGTFVPPPPPAPPTPPTPPGHTHSRL
jgi:hypothetical protein